MKSRYQGTCTNCSKALPKQFVFQGVVICEDCYKIVSHVVQRTKRELSMLFLVYTDMLRAALIKGELRPPVLPPDAGKGMPLTELTQAIKNMGGGNGKDQRPAAGRRGDVPPLRDGPQDQVG